VKIEGGIELEARSIHWLEALSAARASPAAGSAAAITGALGAALLIKLAQFTRPQDIPDHSRLLDRLRSARDRLAALADADSSAITTWIRTRRLPADDPARQAALRAMVSIPLEAAELCRTITIEVRPLLERGHPPALPDGQVGIQLLEACQWAMSSLVRANLPVLADTNLIEATQTRLEQLNAKREESDD
jgi:formiminotetrahydrofolate cyclodeaminase